MKFIEPQKFVFFFPEFEDEKECFAKVINSHIYTSTFEDCTKTQIKYLLAQYDQRIFGRKRRHKIKDGGYEIMPIEVAEAMFQ